MPRSVTLLESNIERPVVKFARDRGVLVLKLNVSGQRGWPDTLMVYMGRVMFLEFKRNGKKPRKLQLHMLDTLNVTGCHAYWVDNIADGKVIVEAFVAGLT